MRDDTKETAAKIPPPRQPVRRDHRAADAPHKVVVYEDFLCPFCGEFEAASHEQLAELADEGKVRVEYRPFVLLDEVGPLLRARDADLVAGAARSPAPRWPRSSTTCCSPTSPASRVRSRPRTTSVALAVQAGANADEIKTAVENDEGVEEVADATKVAEDLGVHSTPTIVLDGKPFQDGATVDDLAANLVEAVQ